MVDIRKYEEMLKKNIAVFIVINRLFWIYIFLFFIVIPTFTGYFFIYEMLEDKYSLLIFIFMILLLFLVVSIFTIDTRQSMRSYMYCKNTEYGDSCYSGNKELFLKKQEECMENELSEIEKKYNKYLRTRDTFLGKRILFLK